MSINARKPEANTRKLDPRVIRTRQMLRDGLMSLAAERDFDGITVQDIADRAGLNRATFYLHYRDKQELLMQIIDSVLEDLANLPSTPMYGADPQEVRRVFIHLFDHVATHAAFYRILLGEPSVAPYVRRVEERLQRIGLDALLGAKLPPDKMPGPADLFITMIGAAYLGAIQWWLLNKLPYTSEFMATQFMRLVIGAAHPDAAWDFNSIDPH